MKSDDQDCCFSQCGPGLSRLWPFQGDPCQVLKFESDPKILVVDQSDKANQENQADKKQLEEKSNILKVREKSESELYKEASGVISLIKVSFEYSYHYMLCLIQLDSTRNNICTKSGSQSH